MRLTSFRGYMLLTALMETAYFSMWPFWSFRDASCGTMLDRAAALRHNIGQRHCLPYYAARWMGALLILLAVLSVADYWMTLSETFKPFLLGLTIGAGFSVAVVAVMIFEIAIVYAGLTCAKH